MFLPMILDQILSIYEKRVHLTTNPFLMKLLTGLTFVVPTGIEPVSKV